MKNNCIVTWLAAVLTLILITSVVAFAQGRASQAEGSKPYAPSRLEWLAVDLNSTMHSDASAENEFTMSFVPIANEDALLIYVNYLPSVNRERMNLKVDTARQVIASMSMSKGWSSWLKVKEQIQLADPK